MNKKSNQLFFINILWLAIYFIIFINLKINVSDEIMFSTPDSTGYLAASEKFLNFSDIRPFLFPLLILLTYGTFGAFGFWFIQFIFWIASMNLLYFAVKQITNSKNFALIASLMMATNLSYIAITLFGIAEVTTIFLISVLIYLISINIKKITELKSFHICVFILVLLTVVKPVFFLPLLFVLFILLPIFYLKKYLQTPKTIITLILVITPLLFQMTVMKIKFNTFSVSKISSLTFKDYLFAQGIQINDQIPWDKWNEAQLKAESYSSREVQSYLFQNKKLYFHLYCNNLKENINASPTYLLFPKELKHTFFASIMSLLNTLYYYLHIVFILPVLICLLFAFKDKNRDYIVLIGFLSALTYYLLLTSGISFWQGDRLVLPALPVFIFLYILVSKYLFNRMKAKKVKVDSIIG